MGRILAGLLLAFAVNAGVAHAQRSPHADLVREPSGSDTAARHKVVLETCRIDNDKLAAKVFFDYGSVFAAHGVRVPTTCVFPSATAVESFQASLKTKKQLIGRTEIELQEAALDRLAAAVDEAARAGLRITPLDGAIAGKRTFEDTIRIWNSRFEPALSFWVRKGKIDPEEARAARGAAAGPQAAMVMAWEEKGYYFGPGRSRSIFYSVAPPGTSQHLSMLAFDVFEARDTRVRAILNRFGWYQTILTDEPHFTYLGVPESQLPARGLEGVMRGGMIYWVPRRDGYPEGRPAAISR